METQQLLHLILRDYLVLGRLSVSCRLQLGLANESQRQEILTRVMGYDLHRRASPALLVDLIASRLQGPTGAAQNTESVQGPTGAAQFILACQLGVYLPGQTLHLIDIGLGVAARYGQLELVQRLLAEGGSPAKALKEAASYGQMEVLRYVLPLPGSKPEKALIGAASHGPLEAVEGLLAYSPGLSYKTFEMAIEYNRLAVVSTLLKATIGADGQRLLAKVHHMAMLDLIRQHFPDLDPTPSADKLLANALTSGDEELFGYALGLGADMTSVAHVHKAIKVAEGGSLLMFQALEAVVSEKDKLYFYHRVLTLAAGNHHPKLVEYILQKGLPLTIEDALFNSLAFDHGRLVGLLLTAPELGDLWGSLSEAIRRGYTEPVRLLVQAGPAMKSAAQAGRLEIVRLLVTIGVPVSVDDVIEAVNRDYLEIVRLLLTHLQGENAHRGLLSSARSMTMGRLLIERFPEQLTDRTIEKLLHNAALYGELELFHFAVAQGASLTTLRARGHTVGIGGSVDILKCLQLVMQDQLRFYEQALTSAVCRRNHDMVEYILGLGLGLDLDETLNQAARHAQHSSRMLSRLLAVPGPKNLQAALVNACSYGHLDNVRLLLEAGATVSEEALEAASEFYPDIEELLQTYTV